ncbi:MAG: two-component regulator propeller domain-containing protein, partial [Bacteroidota bacterium]
MRVPFALLLLTLHFFTLVGQGIPYTFRLLTEENGLPPSEKYFISQDSRGYVWIGTSYGISRFDGREIISYNSKQDVLDKTVTSYTLEDEFGDLWFTTRRALLRYRRAEDSLAVYQLPVNADHYHAFHLDDDGLIWLRIGLGEDGMLWHFDPLAGEFLPTYHPLEGEVCNLVVNVLGEVEKIVQTERPVHPGLKIQDFITQQSREIDFTVNERGEELVFSSKTSGAVIMKNGTLWTGIYNGLGKYTSEAERGL